MDTDLRNNTLISNIFGNLGRLGRNQPSVSPTSAVLDAQRSSLANNLMGVQAKRIEAEMTEEERLRKESERNIQGIVTIRDAVARGEIAPQDAIQKFQSYGKEGKVAADNLIAAIETRWKAAEAERKQKEFEDPTKGFTPSYSEFLKSKRIPPSPEAYKEYLALNKSKGPDPYYTPYPTPEGMVSYDHRTGTGTPLIVEGRPVIRSQDSPPLQGAIAGAEKIGALKGEEDQRLYERVSEAPQKLERINQQIELIKSSDTITGLGANMLKEIERAKVLLGGNADKLTDTQLLEVMLGSDVFSMMQDLGLTSKQMDTPAEREYMKMVLAGTIDLDKNVLLEMSNIKKRAIERGINKWNDRVEKGEMKRWEASTGLKAEKIEIGKKSEVLYIGGFKVKVK